MNPLLLPIDRLVAVLTDPARRERAFIGVLVAYVGLWTLYGVFAKASQDIHFDMAELVAMAREPGFGHIKHPPFAAWLAWIWFAVFPATDWAYYLLAITVVAVAMWIAWRIFERYLDGEKRVVGIALLMLIPFFNFHALKYNNNTVLLPLWALTTYLFLRSIETRRILVAALAGVAAAGTMYGKYWSVTLLIGLGVAALADARRAAYFRSAAPWVTIAAGVITIMPNVISMIASDFAPLNYAFSIHGARSFAATMHGILNFVAGAAAYVAMPVILAVVATRPSRAAIADMLWPGGPGRRLAAVAFWATLAAPIAVALAIKIELTALWTMSAWTLLPVVLLSSPLINVTRADAVRIVALAVMVPLVMLAASPFIAGAIHRAGIKPPGAHYKLLAEQVARVWKEATGQSLQYVGGEASLSYGVAFYLADRPNTFAELDSRASPWIDQATLARTGIVLVCQVSDRGCVHNMETYAGSAGRRAEVEISRSYFGITGQPERYLIIVVPPRAL